MNSLAFVVMLASFALVLGWYALNHERDRDGRDGFLGVRTDEDRGPKAKRAPLFDQRVGTEGPDAAARVRARAARTKAAATSTPPAALEAEGEPEPTER